MLEKRINIAEAKKHLSAIVGEVAYTKKSVILTKRGVPMVEITPLSEKKRKHPADVKGWLEDDDPFFKAIESLRGYIPRVMRTKS